MPINTPPVLAGQMKSSDKEVANAQEQMAATFAAEQEKAIQGRMTIQQAAEQGSDLSLHIYSCRLPSCHYVFKDGSQATFVNGVYKTANPYEIEQLDKEVRAGHPHIYVDKNTPHVVSAKADADPVAAMRMQMEKEIRAQIAAESAPKDMGANRVMDGNSLKPASTSDVQQAVLGGVPTAASQASATGAAGTNLPPSLMAALNKSAGGTN